MSSCDRHVALDVGRAPPLANGSSASNTRIRSGLTANFFLVFFILISFELIGTAAPSPHDAGAPCCGGNSELFFASFGGVSQF